jgi:hypothetical protein
MLMPVMWDSFPPACRRKLDRRSENSSVWLLLMVMEPVEGMVALGSALTTTSKLARKPRLGSLTVKVVVPGL